MANSTYIPGVGFSALTSGDLPVMLPSQADIAGSPPPPTPAVRLWSAGAIKDADNPIMALFASPQSRIQSV